jgi:hypothetical protein
MEWVLLRLIAKIASMSLYAAFCVLLPALLAWSVTAVAAWRLESAGVRPAFRDGRNAAALLLVAALLAGLVAGEPLGRIVRVVLLSSSFAAAALGLFALLALCRVRPAAAQAVAGIAVALSMGAIFAAGAAVESAPVAARQARAELFAGFSPYVLVAGDLFDLDVLHSPTLYGMHLADYLRGVPPYGPAAATWAAAGLLLAGIGLGIRKAAERTP